MGKDVQHCCTPATVAAPHRSDLVSPRAREALLAIENAGALISWCGLSPEEDRVRIALLQMYAEQGRTPAIVDLAAGVGLSASQLQAVLTSLEARDVIVRDKDTGRIIGAYPFTEVESEHRVDLGAQTLHAMCAIDALGVGAMYDRDIRIWSGIRYEHGCAANSLCEVLAFFCSDEHLEAWRQRRGEDSRGFRLSMQEGLETGRAIFENSLKTNHSGATTRD